MAICDSCIDAFVDEGLDENHFIHNFPIELFPLDMGADIADHLCDKREIDGKIKCNCACNTRF